MATVLVLTVGTTPDPLLEAVEEQRRQDPRLAVYLLYGRPFPDQHPSPFDIARQVKERAAALGLRAETREIPDPEDLDMCLRICREALREVSDYDRVLVDFTGGTKPVSAAVVHAALTEPLIGQLVFEYTGGKVRDRNGRVLKEAMRRRSTERTATEEMLRQVLELLPRFAYREARMLARRLPETGRAGFVRHAVEALSAWDEFDYQASRELLRRHREAARAVQDVEQLAVLAGLVLRLLEPANRVVDALQCLQALQDGPLRYWPATEGMGLLVADALENACRRLAEGRPTDAVLRAYRAVETAVHARLVAHHINPWQPDWQKLSVEYREQYERFLDGHPLPRDLALTTGLRLVAVLDGGLSRELTDRLQDLQQVRNRSYLEHGYRRIREEDGHRLLGYAEELCALILKADMRALRESVTHHVWT